MPGLTLAVGPGVGASWFAPASMEDDMDIDSSIITFGSYKGSKLIVLGKDRKFPFQFGIGKANLILAAINAMGAEEFKGFLENFVSEGDKE